MTTPSEDQLRIEAGPELAPPHLPALEELVASDPSQIAYYYTEADMEHLFTQDPDLFDRLVEIDKNRGED